MNNMNNLHFDHAFHHTFIDKLCSARSKE